MYYLALLLNLGTPLFKTTFILKKLVLNRSINRKRRFAFDLCYRAIRVQIDCQLYRFESNSDHISSEINNHYNFIIV